MLYNYKVTVHACRSLLFVCFIKVHVIQKLEDSSPILERSIRKKLYANVQIKCSYVLKQKFEFNFVDIK